MNFFQCLILAMIMCASSATVVAGVADALPLAEHQITTNARDDFNPNNTKLGHMEALIFSLNCSDVDKFLQADRDTWTSFLMATPGFVSKWTMLNPSSDETDSTCTVTSCVHWLNEVLWKGIPGAELARTEQAFEKAFPKSFSRQSFPSPEGFTIASVIGEAFKNTNTGAVELNRFDLPCDNVDRFLAADNSTWTTFLAGVPGFVSKRQLMPAKQPSDHCSIYTATLWASRKQWKAIPASKLEAVAKEFESVYGKPCPPMTRLPTPQGLDVHSSVAPTNGPRVIAINGRDVVAYQSLHPGEKDVSGLPQFVRFLNSSAFLPPNLHHLHPQPYEFWFSSEANAEKFSADPFKYLPAFGGHCTHGIASRNDLTPPLLADGRVAFTCVNTTQWVVINGTTYMNSCGMYADFVKDPEGDIRKANGLWKKWFGSYRGPINDACFQDGGLWDHVNPIGELVPHACVIN